MVSEFSFSRTPGGRGRVSFCIDLADFQRASAIAYARDPHPFGPMTCDPHRAGGRVCVNVSIAGGFVLADALGEVGGNSAIVGRLLTDQLEALVVELRASRQPAAQAPAQATA